MTTRDFSQRGVYERSSLFYNLFNFNPKLTPNPSLIKWKVGRISMMKLIAGLSINS